MVYLGDPIVVADLVTRPSHSIMKQSFEARERLSGGPGYIPLSINADGCGEWTFLGYSPDYLDLDESGIAPVILQSIVTQSDTALVLS